MKIDVTINGTCFESISTGETLYQARIKCPGLQVYPVNYQLYNENSNKLYQLLLQYTDKIER